MSKQPPLSLDNVYPNRIVALSRDVNYVWSADWGDDVERRIAGIRALEVETPDRKFVALSGVHGGYAHKNSRPYLFTVADCFDPPVFLVFGEVNDNDAQETFITEFERMVKIEEPDLKDYDAESLTYNDNGTPCETENLHQWEPDSVALVIDRQK